MQAVLEAAEAARPRRNPTQNDATWARQTACGGAPLARREGANTAYNPPAGPQRARSGQMCREAYWIRRRTTYVRRKPREDSPLAARMKQLMLSGADALGLPLHRRR